MYTTQKFINILSCTNDSDLDREISKISESESKQFLKTMIQFARNQKIEVNDLVQFSQEQF